MTEFAPPTYEEMIAAGRYNLVRSGVNPTAFPLNPLSFNGNFLQIIGFNAPLDILQAIGRLKECGLQPALPEQLLAYIAENLEAHKSYAIVALGAAGRDPRQPPCVMRLCHHQRQRILETRPYIGPLEPHERVLVAHPD